MYSSLPSASKLYASSVIKNKQKQVTNARKKRRKSKVLPALNTALNSISESDTLISNDQNEDSSSNFKYDSDTTESVSEPTVQLKCKDASFLVKEETNISLPKDPSISLDISPIPENSISFELSENKTFDEECSQNVITTAAEIHNNVRNELFSSDLSDEELPSVENVHRLPVIIISSTDSPEHETTEVDSEELFQTSDSVIDKEVIVNHVMSNKLNDSSELMECEKLFDQNGSKPNEITYINKEIDSIDQQIDDNEQKFTFDEVEVNSPFLSNSLYVEEKVDDSSVKSDCCFSKNIYNEYSTETIDDSDQHFMIDDSKQNSTDETSSSLSDSDNIDLERITSPGTSEISGTESSIGDKKPVSEIIEESTYTKSVNIKPILNVPKAALYVPPYVTNDNDMAFTSSCENVITKQKPCIKERFLNRTQSLPDYLNNKVSKNVTFCETGEYYDDDDDDDFPQNIYEESTNNGYQWIENDPKKQHSFHSTSENKIYEIEKSLSTNLYRNNSSELNSILLPVTTQEARLRSYVVGSVRASGSLLGVDELLRYFPERKINVFVGTWNMNGQDAPDCLNDFLLPVGVNYLPDIYAIGVQENSQSRNEWEILMQTTLGPSHVLLTSTSLGVLHLAIFIRRDLIWFCSEPEEANVTTRPGSMVKTKGAVAICFTFFGTSFLFINSHLTAHERKLKERLTDYEKICHLIDLPKKMPLKPQYQSKDVTSRFDCVFWCGDLNFRVVQDRPTVLNFVEEKLKQTMHTWDYLIQHDQLHKAMNEGMAFHGFQEGVINFVPSYKFDVGTCCFNSRNPRVPSYTDRVLYRCKRNKSVCCLHYNVVSDIMTSDHKPVFAVFEVNISPGRDNIPLAAGLFKRDVYLEACKRRAMALEVTTNQKTSAICSIM